VEPERSVMVPLTMRVIGVVVSATAAARRMGIIVVVGAMMSGCWRPDPAPDVPGRNRLITVTFAAPTDIQVLAAPAWRDTVRLTGVSEVRGRVDWAAKDTLYLRLTGASGPALAFGDVPVGGLAVVGRQPGMAVTQNAFSPWRTAGLVVGVATLAAAAWISYFLFLFEWEG
jgi:hypothetical protein